MASTTDTQLRERNHRYYVKHREKFKANRIENRAEFNAWRSEWHRRKKFDVFEVYGGRCVTCGCSDLKCLQIDHVSGDGRLERTRLAQLNQYYEHVKSTFGDGTYQILCANCNWIKRIELKQHRKPKSDKQSASSRHRIRHRDEAIAALGAACSECSFADKRALQIDHVNGDGAQERKRMSAVEIYRRAANNIGGRYQLLCASCNWKKRNERREFGSSQTGPR